MFQSVVNNTQAPAVKGDFASMNPFASVLAGPGALVAPAGGLRVGNFFWVGPAGQTSQSYVAGYQIAFLGRNNQGLVTAFLGEATMIVPAGFMVTGFNEGDFWTDFPAGAAAGDYVFADPNDGQAVANAANSAPTLGAGTASAGFSGTATLNGTTTLNVTAVTHGILSVGDVLADSTTAGNIPAGTVIVAQLTGIAGGVGTYQMSAVGVAAVGDTVVATSQFMLVTAIASGSFNLGDVISGTAVSAGTELIAQEVPFAGVATVGTLPATPSTVLTVTSVQPGTGPLRKGAKINGDGITPGTTISTQVSGTPGGPGVYTMSANSTAEAAGVAVTNGDTPGGPGLYAFSPAPQTFGAAAVPETVSVAGTAQATGFRVRGAYSTDELPGTPPADLWKISTL